MVGCRGLPAPLREGARIGVIAPGSCVNRAAVTRGMRRLEAWGFRPVAGASLFARHGDLAGDDAARAADLAWALESSEIDAVWAARGGWGTARLLETLPRSVRTLPSRWLLGASDLTVLHCWLLMHGRPSLYAPMVTELVDEGRYAVRALRAALTASPRTTVHEPRATRCLERGRAAGTLAGGCLSLLASLAGTRWEPDLSGCIVFLEEVGEAPYRIDRMLWQLAESRMLDGIEGIVFGQFTRCTPGRTRRSRELTQVLAEHARRAGVPAICGFPVGHGRLTRTLPIGFSARLDADHGRLTLALPVRTG